jgi:hypothetical protein
MSEEEYRDSSPQSAEDGDHEERPDAYREQISAVAAQNADYLAALAAMFTEKVPSAAEAVQNLLAVYSASAAKRAADFNQNKKTGGKTHE